RCGVWAAGRWRRVAGRGRRGRGGSAGRLVAGGGRGGAVEVAADVVAAGAAVAGLGVLGPAVGAAARAVAVLAADGHVPRWLGGGARPLGVPERALVAVGTAAAAVVAVDTDLRTAAGVAAFGSLVYSAVANA